MKLRLVGFFLIFSIFLPHLVSILWLNAQKHMVRKEVKKRLVATIDPSELAFLRFSHADAERLLTWEHSKEFAYDGQMYDIVQAYQTPDSVFYRCWLDAEETALNQTLAHLVAIQWDAHPLKHQGEQALVDFCKVYFLPAFMLYVLQSNAYQVYILPISRQVAMATHHLSVLAPPPWLALSK